MQLGRAGARACDTDELCCSAKLSVRAADGGMLLRLAPGTVPGAGGVQLVFCIAAPFSQQGGCNCHRMVRGRTGGSSWYESIKCEESYFYGIRY